MRATTYSIRARAAFLVLAAVTACSEESSECGPTASCVPPVADVQVSDVVIASGSRTHPATGLPVVDSIRVSYKVTNAGGSASAAMGALMGIPGLTGDAVLDSVPALQPGESMTRTVAWLAPVHFFNSHENADLIRAEVALTAPDTDPPHNNRAASDSVHLARPILSLVVHPLSEERVRVTDPMRMTVTIANTSLIAAARDVQLRHCVWEFDVSCWEGSWTVFGNVPVPDLAPGESRTIDYIAAVTPTGSEEGYMHYSLMVCVSTRADTG